jgi:hypothetical protein
MRDRRRTWIIAAITIVVVGILAIGIAKFPDYCPIEPGPVSSAPSK